jgi:hypothetical protein
VPNWEVESLGGARVASWHCERCTARSVLLYRDAGDDGAGLRNAAISHLKITGHAVTFDRGTTELLTPLATEPAATEGER